MGWIYNPNISSSGGAPVDATYITLTNNASLTQNRTLAVNSTLTMTDGGATNPLVLGINLNNANIWTANQTFADNIGGIFGTTNQGKIYYDATDLIINPALSGSGQVSIGPTSSGGGTANLVANFIGLGGTATSTTSIINVNISSSVVRAAMSFTLDFTGSGNAMGPVTLTSTDNGTNTGTFTYGSITSSQQIVSNSHTNFTQYGAQFSMGVSNSTDITVAGNKNIYGIRLLLSTNGRAGTGTSAGVFVRCGIVQDNILAIQGSPTSDTRYGAHFNNQIQMVAGQAIILDGASGLPGATAGDTTIKYVTANTRVELGVDGTDAIYYSPTQISNLLYTAFSDKINLASVSSSTTSGDVWRDSTQKGLSIFMNGIQQQVTTGIFTQTADATVANTTTETSIIGTGVGTKTLPANFFIAGKTVRIRGGGKFSTKAAPTGNVTVKVKYGSTVIASYTLSTQVPDGASGQPFDYELIITCRTTGATGTVMMTGFLTHFAKSIGTNGRDWANLNNGGATTTIDTTASSALDVTWTWATADASNTATGTVCEIESIN